MKGLGYALIIPPVDPITGAIDVIATLASIFFTISRNRHAEDLRPNDSQGQGSFPFHHDDGTPWTDDEIQALTDKYQYADFTIPSEISVGPEEISLVRQNLGDMFTVQAKDALGNPLIFTSARALINAMTAELAWPYHDDGTPYDVVWNGVDFIMDGRPIQDYWQSGNGGGGSGSTTIDGITETLAGVPWWLWAVGAYAGYRLLK